MYSSWSQDTQEGEHTFSSSIPPAVLLLSHKGKHLDAPATVTDENAALVVHANAIWASKLAGLVARVSKGGDEHAVLRKDLHASIELVAHEPVAGVIDADAIWVVQR